MNQIFIHDNSLHGKIPQMKYRENTDVISVVLILILQREQRGKNTKRNKMLAGEKTQTNHGNQKAVAPKGGTVSSAKKTKTEISNSFLHRIISLLKKEELI